MHLDLAHTILHDSDLSVAVRRTLRSQRGAFYLGNTAPDVQTVSGQARDGTHFYSVPRTSTRPAYEALFDAYPGLAHPWDLPPGQATFIAGYIAHLEVDEVWLDEVFIPHFVEQDWGTRHERLFTHNVLRTWMDREAYARLNSDVVEALREAEPQGWLPFAEDEHVRMWRDWLVEQLEPGNALQTAEVFAERMGVTAIELESIITSSEQMQKQIFRHVSRGVLESFEAISYRRSVDLIGSYFAGRLSG